MTHAGQTTAALVDQAEPVGAANGGDNGDPFFQISAGPAALAQATIYQMMDLYLKIMDLDRKQKLLTLETQGAAARGQAEATRQAGQDQGAGLIASGVLSVVGGGVSVGAALYKTEAYKTANKNATEAQNKLAPLVELDKQQAEKTGGAGVGPRPAREIIASDNNLIAKMKAGNFDLSPAEQTQAAEIMYGRNMERDNPAAALEYRTIKETLDQKRGFYSEQLSTYTREMNNASMVHQAITGTISPFTQGLGSGAQGITTMLKADEEANSQLKQTTSSMAGSSAQGYGEQMTKMYDQALSALQILVKLENAGQAGRG